MVKIDTSGLDNLMENLKKLDQKKTISSEESLTPEFMKRYTKFDSWDDMCKASGIEGSESFESEAFSEFVAQNSEFKDFNEMWQKAGQEYITKQLGF